MKVSGIREDIEKNFREQFIIGFRVKSLLCNHPG